MTTGTCQATHTLLTLCAVAVAVPTVEKQTLYNFELTRAHSPTAPPHRTLLTVSAMRSGMKSLLPLRFCALPSALAHFLNPPDTSSAWPSSPLSYADSTADATSPKLSSRICKGGVQRHAGRQGAIEALNEWSKVSGCQQGCCIEMRTALLRAHK